MDGNPEVDDFFTSPDPKISVDGDFAESSNDGNPDEEPDFVDPKISVDGKPDDDPCFGAKISEDGDFAGCSSNDGNGDFFPSVDAAKISVDVDFSCSSNAGNPDVEFCFGFDPVKTSIEGKLEADPDAGVTAKMSADAGVDFSGSGNDGNPDADDFFVSVDPKISVESDFAGLSKVGNPDEPKTSVADDFFSC